MSGLPEHLDCPACHDCGLPCGCADEVPKGWLRCGACGEAWQASAAEIAQAKRADAAYRKHRAAEDEAEREAAFVSGLPRKLREANRRQLDLLEALRSASPTAEQLDLLAPRPAP